MSDWVHCNRCSRRHCSNLDFYLVDCGHIFCQRCAEITNEVHKCKLCNKPAQMLLLSNDVDQSIMDFFLPVESLIKKSMEVYKFQLQHRESLFHNLLNKYNYAKKEYIKCHNKNMQLMKENEMLSSMLRSAGQNPLPFTTSTPYSQGYTSRSQGNSIISSVPSSIGKNLSALKMHPGYANRMAMYNSGSSSQYKPSPPVQRKSNEPTPIHGSSGGSSHRVPASMGTMCSLAQLRRRSLGDK